MWEKLGRVWQFPRNLSVFVAHDERRYAKHASQQLLDLYKSKQRDNPALNGPGLYEAVIAQRLGPEADRAADVIKRAEQSFADWPVKRDLRFRHVVHYQIFDEYIRQSAARQGTRTNIGVVVARMIPEDI